MKLKKISAATQQRLLEEVAAWLKAVADPSRLRILHALRGGERCVNDLLAELGCSQANVSKHLAVLRGAGLVASRREGVSVYYRIADQAVFTICEAVCESIRKDLDGRKAGLERARSLLRGGAH